MKPSAAASDPTPHVLVVTGLKREAQMLAGPGVRTVVSGGRVEALLQRLEQACADTRPRGLVSMGLGGALAADLAVGQWVLARAVVADAERIATDPVWTANLQQRLSISAVGDIVGMDHMVADRAAKSALRQRTQGLAVDMESHVAARFAQSRGLPFVAARVISDTADRNLPWAATVGMSTDGAMNLPAVLLALLRDPRQLPALIRTGREASTALEVLLRSHDLLGGPGIGCPYLG